MLLGTLANTKDGAGTVRHILTNRRGKVDVKVVGKAVNQEGCAECGQKRTGENAMKHTFKTGCGCNCEKQIKVNLFPQPPEEINKPIYQKTPWSQDTIILAVIVSWM